MMEEITNLRIKGENMHWHLRNGYFVTINQYVMTVEMLQQRLKHRRCLACFISFCSKKNPKLFWLCSAIVVVHNNGFVKDIFRKLNKTHTLLILPHYTYLLRDKEATLKTIIGLSQNIYRKYDTLQFSGIFLSPKIDLIHTIG